MIKILSLEFKTNSEAIKYTTTRIDKMIKPKYNKSLIKREWNKYDYIFLECLIKLMNQKFIDNNDNKYVVDLDRIKYFEINNKKSKYLIILLKSGIKFKINWKLIFSKIYKREKMFIIIDADINNIIADELLLQGMEAEDGNKQVVLNSGLFKTNPELKLFV